VGTEPRSASIGRADARRRSGPPSPGWTPSLGGVLEATAASLRTAALHWVHTGPRPRRLRGLCRHRHAHAGSRARRHDGESRQGSCRMGPARKGR